MYRVPTKTAVVQALRGTLDYFYPEKDFENVNITLDFPIRAQDYPAIWIDFDDTEPVERAGIKHEEFVVDDDGVHHTVTRYRFGGNLTFTIGALSNQERDRLFDQLVRIFAFNDVDQTSANRFRTLIENNEYIGININYDVMNPGSSPASPGTPWETNEVIYETSLSLALIGEFVSDPSTSTLVPLRKVIWTGVNVDENDPSVEFPDLLPGSSAYSTTDWI